MKSAGGCHGVERGGEGNMCCLLCRGASSLVLLAAPIGEVVSSCWVLAVRMGIASLRAARLHSFLFRPLVRTFIRWVARGSVRMFVHSNMLGSILWHLPSPSVNKKKKTYPPGTTRSSLPHYCRPCTPSQAKPSPLKRDRRGTKKSGKNAKRIKNFAFLSYCTAVWGSSQLVVVAASGQ